MPLSPSLYFLALALSLSLSRSRSRSLALSLSRSRSRSLVLLRSFPQSPVLSHSLPPSLQHLLDKQPNDPLHALKLALVFRSFHQPKPFCFVWHVLSMHNRSLWSWKGGETETCLPRAPNRTPRKRVLSRLYGAEEPDLVVNKRGEVFRAQIGAQLPELKSPVVDAKLRLPRQALVKSSKVDVFLLPFYFDLLNFLQELCKAIFNLAPL